MWRKSQDSPVFKDPFLWKVFCWCMIKASHKERWVTMRIGRGTTQVQIKPGQFIYGRLRAAAELDMPASSVRNRMERLQALGCINIPKRTGQKDRSFSIVTVVNWDKYQNCLASIVIPGQRQLLFPVLSGRYS